MPFGNVSREEALESVGPGWADLVNEAYDLAEANGATVVQVKEKYGGLRLYVDGLLTYKYVAEVEKRSYLVCEACGKDGELRRNGWWRTLCDSCLAEGWPHSKIRESHAGQ